MKIEIMSKHIAENKYNTLRHNNFTHNDKVSGDYLNLRNKIKEAFDTTTSVYKKEYDIDMNFGLMLYDILNHEVSLNKDMTLAADIKYWIYISMEIVPDLIYARWGDSETRFYKHTKRVWLNSLWWYVHLSWQGSSSKTKEVLRNLNTDTIVNLIERTTGKGYNLELTRALIKELSKHKEVTKLFRRVMVLNTIYYKTTEPAFYPGGYDGYVKMLFDKANSR